MKVKITNVGNRGLLFSFNELNKPPYNCITNVYTIIGKNKYFICDTYLGRYYMELITEYLESNYGKKDYIIFNSHSHWDHIWGNSQFNKHLIVSHQKCRELISLESDEEIKAHSSSFTREKINIVLPNLTFENKLIFEEDNVEFFYSPGHSEDSSSCYDKEDKTLFVGDNVEDPIPTCMCWSNVDRYILTLQHYLEIDAKRIVISHGPVTDNDLIRDNIDYICKIKRNENIDFNDDVIVNKHNKNLDFLNIKCKKNL